jgi:acyl-CoA synthetase (AMP-forming)/AMP-acid ligase II
MISAGDLFPTAVFRSFAQITKARFFNFYGPTETNVCLAHEWSAQEEGSDVPIGSPVAGNSCQIDGGQLAGEGELLVAGPTLMTGYFGDPDATAASFKVLDDGKRFFRTGDLVRLGADGLFRFLGRSSGIIKTYGYRVHPAEVEAALRELRGLRDCAVLATPDPLAGQVLHAWIVADDPKSDLAAEAQRHLQSRLPSYMVPAEFTLLPVLPYLPNGKLNREKLLLRGSEEGDA